MLANWREAETGGISNNTENWILIESFSVVNSVFRGSKSATVSVSVCRIRCRTPDSTCHLSIPLQDLDGRRLFLSGKSQPAAISPDICTTLAVRPRPFLGSTGVMIWRRVFKFEHHATSPTACPKRIEEKCKHCVHVCMMIGRRGQE